MSKHTIKEFIKHNLDLSLKAGEIDEFTVTSVVAEIDGCRELLSHDVTKGVYMPMCGGCGDFQFPCRRLRLAAEWWDDSPEYDEEWRLK